MTIYVQDTFTGTGTLATHVGEVGADWANPGAAIFAGTILTDYLDLLPNYVLDGTSVEHTVGLGYMFHAAWSSGVVMEPEVYFEVEATCRTLTYGNGQLRFGLRKLDTGGYLEAITNGIGLDFEVRMDIYEGDGIYAQVLAKQYVWDTDIPDLTHESVYAQFTSYDVEPTGWPAPTFNEPHVYRVEVRADSITVKVDGVVVATHTDFHTYADPGYEGPLDATGCRFFFDDFQAANEGGEGYVLIHRVEVGSLVTTPPEPPPPVSSLFWTDHIGTIETTKTETP